MIDISNAKYDFSKEEAYAIQWLNDKGFEGKLVRQSTGKTVFQIEKDGVKDKFELPQGIVFKSIKKYMEQFQKCWEMIVKKKSSETTSQ